MIEELDIDIVDHQIRLTTLLKPDDEGLQYILGALRNSKAWLVFSPQDTKQNRVVMSIDGEFELYHTQIGDSHEVDYKLLTRWIRSSRFEKRLVVIEPRLDY